jgi:dethiobiotin synthetase
MSCHAAPEAAADEQRVDISRIKGLEPRDDLIIREGVGGSIVIVKVKGLGIDCLVLWQGTKACQGVSITIECNTIRTAQGA